MASSNVSLINHFLIAAPTLQDPSFTNAVIYMCEHHNKGAAGLIINRPLYSSMHMIFKQLHIDLDKSRAKTPPLLFGGPYAANRGFVIHRPNGAWNSSIILRNDVTITTSNDIIEAIANSKGPQDALITLGYTLWSENQLEQEIMENKWLVCPFKTEILYEVPFAERWHYSGLTIGVKMNQLLTNIGHA